MAVFENFLYCSYILKIDELRSSNFQSLKMIFMKSDFHGCGFNCGFEFIQFINTYFLNGYVFASFIQNKHFSFWSHCFRLSLWWLIFSTFWLSRSSAVKPLYFNIATKKECTVLRSIETSYIKFFPTLELRKIFWRFKLTMTPKT